ncbi:hypothetical protein [Candidatus Leptofilum sp.]|uniref:hypothetical protein n=1 Tax=Candidatus Leptofilum sp. TaxID=3241576 RepID=UPI003B595EC1
MLYLCHPVAQSWRDPLIGRQPSGQQKLYGQNRETAVPNLSRHCCTTPYDAPGQKERISL